ncbi:4'-phosphopantetheinyl transferase [Streptomyces sp. NPDC049040]|uniref:4'-phosphopantetheinyl transferase family protein n=1 Tax=Streptomyces sp. NPDC049040 TaxID=3365593 RepID=UPI003712AA77
MIEELLPEAVAVAESWAGPVAGELHPEEERFAVDALGRRSGDFVIGRHCAHTALRRLGVPPSPILSGESGAPLWPRGVVGSITHCPGYGAAAVVRAGDVVTVGIDAEPCEALPGGVLKLVSLPREREDLARLSGLVPWDKLLFSAKESVYKAWFPLTGKWLGFRDAQVTFDADGGAFDARLLVPGPTVAGRRLTGFTGRWLVRDGLLATAVALPA